MSAQPTPSRVTSEISGIRAASNVPPIEAAYFTLSDRDGRGQGGLVVLLDSLARPVRAELHIYDDLDAVGREYLTRQAQQILQQRYYARQAVPLRIYDARLDAHPINVSMPAEPPPGVKPRKARSKRNGLPLWLWAVIALIPLVLLIWMGARFLGGGNDAPATTAPVEAAEETQADTPPTAVAAPVSEELPPSINANSNIGQGVRVRIVPGLKAYLLDQPDAVNGAQVGAITDGEAMTVRDGPVMRRGTSDTIVWWYVVTDAGAEGWAPANTSELTLLEPVQE